ncbi:MAG: plasmid recombination protein, partial [Clostridia bacterium]|nr:plasmid recombination protein [Clostridia bacterium]
MSDGYGILRVQKIKKSSWGEIRGRLMHATREFQDGSRTGPETAKALANLRAMLGEVTSERSDAVGSLEIVITSTADVLSLEDQKKFLADGLKWVADEFKEKNIFGTYLHDDEKVLHLHVFVCPREWK